LASSPAIDQVREPEAEALRTGRQRERHEVDVGPAADVRALDDYGAVVMTVPCGGDSDLSADSWTSLKSTEFLD